MSCLAAIDIGTVTTRLLIADVSGSHLEPLVRKTHMTQLGEGLARSGRLSEEALDRVAAAIDAYRIDIRACNAMRVIAIATSAARDAENADELIALLSARDIELSVISGDDEARLTFLGNASSFPGYGLLVADVGGGSTELVCGDLAGSADGSASVSVLIRNAHSFNIGCRRMTDGYLCDDPPSTEQMEQLERAVKAEMAPYIAGFAEPVSRMIACAGTATSLVAIRDSMAVYDSSRVHGAKINRRELVSLENRLASLPLAERREVVGLQPERAGIIVAGVVILRCILELSGLDDFTVSESDILQGILLDAAKGEC